MHDLSLKNPDEIKAELDSVSEQMSEALYTFRRCEEFKKITFSQITLTNKIEKNYSILKGKYANLQSWVDLYRSWLVTNRELSR